MFNSFNLTEVVTVWVVSFSRFVSFVVGLSCAVQYLKGCFFSFGLKTVHLYYAVGIITGVCCWVEDSVFSSGMVGRGCPKVCIFNCPICFSVEAA